MEGKGMEGKGAVGKGKKGKWKGKRADRVLAPPRRLGGAGWKEAYAGSVGGLSDRIN